MLDQSQRPLGIPKPGRGQGAALGAQFVRGEIRSGGQGPQEIVQQRADVLAEWFGSRPAQLLQRRSHCRQAGEYGGSSTTSPGGGAQSMDCASRSATAASVGAARHSWASMASWARCTVSATARAIGRGCRASGRPVHSALLGAVPCGSFPAGECRIPHLAQSEAGRSRSQHAQEPRSVTGPVPIRQPDAIALDHLAEEHYRPAPPPTVAPGPAAGALPGHGPQFTPTSSRHVAMRARRAARAATAQRETRRQPHSPCCRLPSTATRSRPARQNPDHPLSQPRGRGQCGAESHWLSQANAGGYSADQVL